MRPLLQAIKESSWPGAGLLINEFGTEIPNEMDSAQANQRKGDWDPLYQPAAAAVFAYAFSTLAALGGVDALGMSQLIGNPNNYSVGGMQLEREYYPGMSMLNWEDASPHPRYLVLKQLIALDGALLVPTRLEEAWCNEDMHAQCFELEHALVTLVINKRSHARTIDIDSQQLLPLHALTLSDIHWDTLMIDVDGQHALSMPKHTNASTMVTLTLPAFSVVVTRMTY